MRLISVGIGSAMLFIGTIMCFAPEPKVVLTSGGVIHLVAAVTAVTGFVFLFGIPGGRS